MMIVRNTSDLWRSVGVFLDTFNSYDIGLKFTCHSDKPIKCLSYLQTYRRPRTATYSIENMQFTLLKYQ